MINPRLIRAGLCAAILLITSVTRPALSQDALFNEGFEGAFQNDAAGGGDCAQNTCTVPAGWGVWFTRRTDTDPPGVNFQPKYEQTRNSGRIKSGASALRYYTSQATHTGGVYRVVTGVTPGARLRISASGQVWSTNDESPISARPSRDVRLKIGIDPLGGEGGKANPFSPQIVWSGEQSPLDAFKDFSAEVEARSTTVIVYLYSTMKDSVRHNEIFWDDVVLTLAAPPTTPTPEGVPPPSPTVEATAAATVAPATAPAVTNDVTVTVKAGDTLLGIAFDNGISLEELQRLNPDASPQTLQIGQVLIIKKGNPSTAATDTPVPGAVAPGTTVDSAVASAGVITGTPTVGAACVQAYFDDDGNGERAERGEDLVPQILFTLSRDGKSAASYTSNGVDEPYCFENLENGEYVVAATVLQIYQPSTPINDTVNVRGGRTFFSIGIRRITDAAVDVSATATPAAGAPIVTAANVVSLVAVLGGLFMIIGLIGFLISAFLRRRRL
jgi:LysM repeat protein